MNDTVFSFGKAEDSPGYLLWQVTTLWQREIKKRLDELNVTHSQYVLLASLLWLTGQERPVTQIDLSLHSKIDPMTTSTVLRTLEKKGWVQRAEHPTDTRAKTVVLTPAGIDLVRRAIPVVEQTDLSFFSATDVGELNRHLRKLIG
ncbi:MarR family winged helix-turn-helix transcriptional regulator [Siphonobacter aquaeclarae]|uniref:Transcriptional regulator, MarR family n=1 Tax=Siphonobacter aquaeclarae TaxID=563176 RepID=A0A1G9IJX2_9BACT|nr:MarR family transcriptional regulator [Siphonobacter aquaeclarae]SDL25539.1 transcriptional regulator, MarR family [Siphonobacter aquaeclarae]